MSVNTKAGVAGLPLLASAWRVTAMGSARLIKVIYHPPPKKGSLPGAKQRKGKYLNYIFKGFIYLFAYLFTYLLMCK